MLGSEVVVDFEQARSREDFPFEFRNYVYSIVLSFFFSINSRAGQHTPQARTNSFMVLQVGRVEVATNRS